MNSHFFLSSLQGTFKLTTLRIMGTISGSCVAYLAVALFGAENGAQYAIMFVWIIICGLFFFILYLFCLC